MVDRILDNGAHRAHVWALAYRTIHRRQALPDSRPEQRIGGEYAGDLSLGCACGPSLAYAAPCDGYARKFGRHIYAPYVRSCLCESD